MSQVIAKYPVQPKADRDDEKAARKQIRTVKAGMKQIVDGAQAAIDALAGAPIGTVRASLQDVLRQQAEIAEAVKKLCRIVGGADR